MTTEESNTENRPDIESRDLAMSRMKDEIEAIAKIEADEIYKEAETKANEILERANQEAKDIKRHILDEARNEAEKLKVREVSRKKLAIKMDYLETREAIIDEILVEARSHLQKYTKSKDYPAFLEKLVKSSAISIGGGELNIHLRKEDKSHFTKDSLVKISQEVSKLTGVDTNIGVAEGNLEALGGIRLVRADKKLFVDNTFESRLERKNEDTRVALLQTLS